MALGLLLTSLSPAFRAQSEQAPAPIPSPAPAPATAAGESLLTGEVFDTDGKPLEGVTVVALHLATEEIYRSAPTDRKGRFNVENVPLGYFDVAVETPEGLFIGNAVVNVPPSGKAIIEMTIAPFGAGTPGPTRDFPVVEANEEGYARVDERLTKKDFWKSPKGIAILAGTGGAILLGLATSDDSSEPVASPF